MMKGVKDKKAKKVNQARRRGSKIDEDAPDSNGAAVTGGGTGGGAGGGAGGATGGGGGGQDEFVDVMQHSKLVVKPDDQLQLTEQELKEEFTRILTATNPHAPQNIVRFNFKEMCYKPIAQVDQLAVHFSVEGNLLHKDSDEGRRQMARMGRLVTEDQKEEKEQQDGADADMEDTMSLSQKEVVGGEPEPSEKKLTNQFNFCERASQTYNNPARDRGNVTEPPPRSNFSDNITQWVIYDTYLEDFEKQQQNKEKKPTFGAKIEEKSKKKLTSSETAADEMSKIAKPIKIVERMVNQNTFDEISQDFKYYEDPSDEYRDQQGTLLPLWRFTFEKAKKIAVTALSWSPKYHDLFAVGHGSYDFMKQSTGLICFYTLKNPSYPEYIFETQSGVLSLDLHRSLPHMLCVGFYDGAVGVYNITQKKSGPLYLSTAQTGKHTDPVWEVRWQREDFDNNLNFYSVSADGRVSSWTLIKNDIVCHDVIEIKLADDVCQGPEGANLLSLSSGTCFAFNPQQEHIFLIGTEEGDVHKCSKAYSTQFLDTYHAHHMAVYKVAWNAFHSDIFITCSADWTIRIWDHNKKEPLFVFDLGSPVGDVAWAPYSSTVFAAATANGSIYVYDLSINKYEPICEQLIASKKKTKLTHVSFNLKYPILIVGDDRGQITSLKLSPNLRRAPKEKKGLDVPKGPEVEIQKLEKILSLVG